MDGYAQSGGDSGWWSVRPRRTLLLIVLFGAGAGGLLAGPVAAVALAGYGALGGRAWFRRVAATRRVQRRREQLDRLCALAADLRAGLPVPVAAERLGLSRPATTPTTPDLDLDIDLNLDLDIDVDPMVAAGLVPPGLRDARTPAAAGAGVDAPPAGRVEVARAAPAGPGDVERIASPGPATAADRPGQLAQAAVRLADRTGAPLAELVERIEADARSADRALAAAAAQAAGARATAWLLAALPLGGVALGYGIGVDPLQVLLYTPIGGACAVAAIALQLVGLVWADRLGAPPDGGS
ncbi:type II secretion system F family protein [Micromonospora radicis]|uniref:type II secretion system F family protein n=1 Tax=Micromonospora radicis TaxID=1894971 RepID=UPI0026AD647D|nr:hypothetical protein [Micromonospora radicis]